MGEQQKALPPGSPEEAPPEFNLANAEVLFGNHSIGWYRWAAWYAEKIARSGIIPFKDPAQAFAVLCKGDELGLPQFASWNLMYMTKAGRLALMSKGALAVVQSKPSFDGYSERIEGSGTTMKAIATAKRKGFAPTVKEFSYEQAERAGLLKPRRNREGEIYDSTYQSYLEDMLLARARARALDIAFAAELGGIAIEGAAEDADTMEARRHEPTRGAPVEKPTDQKLIAAGGKDPLIEELKAVTQPVDAELVPATLVQAEIAKSVDEAFGPLTSPMDVVKAAMSGTREAFEKPAAMVAIVESGAADPAQAGAGTPAEPRIAQPRALAAETAGPAPASAKPHHGPWPTCPKCGRKMHPKRGCDSCFQKEQKAPSTAPCPRCHNPLNVMNGCDVCGYPGPDNGERP